jgi:transcriptional regulator with XRE-family HTH domain
VPEESPVYPNLLREVRDSQALTRVQLAALCGQLAEQDPIRYTAVGESTVKHIELGKSQPRASTAATIAKALEMSVSELFPAGIDTKSRLDTRV